MASAYKEIPIMLRGGLNTAIDPSIIRDDQLREATGLEYRPPRMGLFASGGRSRGDTGTILGAKTFGLVFTQVDGGQADGYLVALASPSATAFGYIASAQSDGTLAFLPIGTTSIPTGTHLWSSSATGFADAVQYRGWWHFTNGADKTLMLDEANIGAGAAASYLWKQHGFIAITASGVAVATATGAGGTVVSYPPGTYEVWWTERGSHVVDRENNNISAAYSGTPSQVIISASGLGIRFDYPTTVAINKSSPVLKTVFITPVNQKYPFGFDGSPSAIFITSTTAYLNTPDNTKPYPVVGPYGGIPVSSNAEPPKAAAIELYKTSICCIDAAERQVLRFSLADEPYAFPDINYVPVETPNNDRGTALRTLDDKLLWFGARHMIRFNYLPRHTDSEDITAGRGNCYDLVTDAHGCLSPRGVCTFAIVDGEPLCLFVCRCGIHITDGTRVGYATEDIDWDATVSKAHLSRCTLKNNPKKHRIEFYYVDATDTTKFKRLDLYYHPMLLQGRSGGFPRMPVMGPLPVPGLAAAVGLFNSEHQVWAGDDNNPRVWVEATGLSDAAQLENADGRITKAWKTKNFYFAGMQGEYELFKLYTHQSQSTASGTYTITGEGKTDDAGQSFIATSQVDQTETGAQPHPALHARAQRFSIRGEKVDGGAWQELNYLVFVVKGASELHSAKSS